MLLRMSNDFGSRGGATKNIDDDRYAKMPIFS